MAPFKVSIQFLSQMKVPQQYDTWKHPFILLRHTQYQVRRSWTCILVITSTKIGWTYTVKTSWKTCLTLQSMLLESIDCRLKVEQKNVKRFSLHHEEKIYNKNYCSLPIHSFLLNSNISSGMCGKNPLWLDLMSNPITTAVSWYKAISKENSEIFHSPVKMVNNK